MVCIINNKTKIKINSFLDEENNEIEFKNEEIITEQGNLTLNLSNNNKKIELKVQVFEKAILNNTKFYIKTNMLHNKDDCYNK